MNVLLEASAGSLSGVTTALTNGITTVASDALSAIGSIVPVALPIMGAMAVVGIGIRIFKKVAGK